MLASGGQCHHTGGISDHFVNKSILSDISENLTRFLVGFYIDIVVSRSPNSSRRYSGKQGTKNSDLTYGWAGLLGVAGATAGALLEDLVNFISHANIQRRM